MLQVLGVATCGWKKKQASGRNGSQVLQQPILALAHELDLRVHVLSLFRRERN